ncbi:MAG: hypothetical protein SOW78_03620 [Clostridia bacterium]|nr:hypothetical protein [Clostridia bacterium]
MRHDYVTIFLDLMDYLNTNAQKMGGRNIKDLMQKAVNRGYYACSDWEKRKFIYFCDLRNEVAHGGASYASEISEDVIYEMYFTGMFILFLSSEEWMLAAVNNDIYCYNEGELKVKFSKLIKKVKQDRQLLFIDFFHR